MAKRPKQKWVLFRACRLEERVRNYTAIEETRIVTFDHLDNLEYLVDVVDVVVSSHPDVAEDNYTDVIGHVPDLELIGRQFGGAA
jgi:hypothetical protein